MIFRILGYVICCLTRCYYLLTNWVIYKQVCVQIKLLKKLKYGIKNLILLLWSKQKLSKDKKLIKAELST